MNLSFWGAARQVTGSMYLLTVDQDYKILIDCGLDFDKERTEYENPDLEGLLIYYYCLLMEAYEIEGIELKKVEVSEIEAFEEEFLSVLESYFEDENLEELEEYTGQPDLVHFMLVEISTPDEDGTTLEDETGVQLFISMMALISVISKTN
jgi:hypothetical protein